MKCKSDNGNKIRMTKCKDLNIRMGDKNGRGLSIEGEIFIAQEGGAIAHSPVGSGTDYGNPGVAFSWQGTCLSWMLQGCLVGQEGKAYHNHMVGEVDGI